MEVCYTCEHFRPCCSCLRGECARLRIEVYDPWALTCVDEWEGPREMNPAQERDLRNKIKEVASF